MHIHVEPLDAAESPGGLDAEILVEREQRLSRSILWRLQRRYFHLAGIDAWRTSTVPHYVTNNPALAHAYAEVFLGFLRDARDARLDPDQPVTLVELGAGSGRFAYLFLKAFAALHGRSVLAGVPFRYIMTDVTETNLDFWQAHDALMPFVERGVLDFAVFDAEGDAELDLRVAKLTISAGSLRNPVAVIGNYVFDGISQDAFSFEGGRIDECLVSLSLSLPEAQADLEDPSLIRRLLPSYSRRPASGDCYQEAELNDILRHYAHTRGDVTLTFPCTAMRCLRRLAELSGGRLLLLSGDRGDIHEDAVGGPGEPRMAIHGSFSMDVNFHAIGEYVRRRGGRVLKTAHRHSHLNVSAFLLGAHPTGWAETALAYEQAIERLGPDDLFSLRRGIEGSYELLELEQILAMIRLSRFDPRILRDCLPALRSRLGEATEVMKRDATEAVQRCWENYYPIGEAHDLGFELAGLLYELGRYGEALGMLQGSVRLHGDDPRTRWNMALCHLAAGQPDEAMERFVEAMRLDPRFKPEGAIQVKRESAM